MCEYVDRGQVVLKRPAWELTKKAVTAVTPKSLSLRHDSDGGRLRVDRRVCISMMFTRLML